MAKIKRVEVELTFPGKYKDEPIFYNITKEFKVIPNILEASFSTDMGWAIVTFEADQAELDRLFGYLEKNDVSYNLK